MKAITQDRYGSADVLELEDIDKPAVGGDEVLVRVRAASVNALDWHFMRGSPFIMRMVSGLRRPKPRVRGRDVAGQVEAVGRDVRQLKPGDEVFGCCDGAFAEYACAAEDGLVLKPANLTFEQAAATGVAALTALQGLRDVGRIQSGQKGMVIGASGGVGTFAVQIAKSLGAEGDPVRGGRPHAGQGRHHRVGWRMPAALWTNGGTRLPSSAPTPPSTASSGRSGVSKSRGGTSFARRATDG